MKRKTVSGLATYLESCGISNASSPEAIARCRNMYLNECKRRYKHEKSKREHSFTVWFTNEELAVIAEASCAHEVSKTRYIQQACLAYAKRKYLVIGRAEVAEIKQMLALNHTDLLSLFDENRLPYDMGIDVLRRMECLEEKILHQLLHPKLLEQ